MELEVEFEVEWEYGIRSRMGVEFEVVSSGWFNPTEPPRTPALQRTIGLISHVFGVI